VLSSQPHEHNHQTDDIPAGEINVKAKNVILLTNATPVYSFLSYINTTQPPDATAPQKKILDCGAGGPVPPVALFHQHGFEAWGIDVSDVQLQKAEAFSQERGLDLHLRQGDMRHMPFEDESFDYVYEHYAMCHLSKKDTAVAVGEMHRVLKPGGLCFLGFISMDSWPKANFGQEKEPGEFWSQEHGDRHSMFTNEEADQLVSAWEVTNKEKRAIYLRRSAEETSLERWMDLYSEAPAHYSRQAWEGHYAQRANEFKYAHLYYFLKKHKD
jgi:ubiquinone/menaquinone biosynthesis C-methylase UbiE